jgi:hypothetical protein
VIALTRVDETSMRQEGSGLARRTAAVSTLVGVAFWATGAPEDKAPEDKKEEKNTGRIAIRGGGRVFLGEAVAGLHKIWGVKLARNRCSCSIFTS